jgi:hypothetical protein
MSLMIASNHQAHFLFSGLSAFPQEKLVTAVF